MAKKKRKSKASMLSRLKALRRKYGLGEFRASKATSKLTKKPKKTSKRATAMKRFSSAVSSKGGASLLNPFAIAGRATLGQLKAETRADRLEGQQQ